MNAFQDDFDMTIGRLDRILSKLVGWGRLSKDRNTVRSPQSFQMDEVNQQTLKHHAEDIITAGQKILRDLDKPIPSEQITCTQIAGLTPEQLNEIDSVE